MMDRGRDGVCEAGSSAAYVSQAEMGWGGDGLAYSWPATLSPEVDRTRAAILPARATDPVQLTCWNVADGDKR